MRHLCSLLTVGILLSASTALFGQDPAPRGDDRGDRNRTEKTRTEGDVSYGKIKEFSEGQRVVVAIDNAPDKKFDLTDKDLKADVAKNLKVGDTVKVTEHANAVGKTHTVTIAKHDGPTKKQ